MDRHHFWWENDDYEHPLTILQPDLTALNMAFLLQCRDTRAGPIARPPAALDVLAMPQLMRLARCPFALFRVLIRPASNSGEPAVTYGAVTSRQQRPLPLLAAEYCRFVAATGPDSSALVLGLSESQRLELLSHDLDKLQRHQSAGELRLEANFGWSPGYWDSLVKSVLDPGFAALRYARLQGIQLLAAAAGGLITTGR